MKTIMLLDCEITLYQCVVNALVEEQHGSEWTYAMDEEAAIEAFDQLVEDFMHETDCDETVMAFGSASSWRKQHVDSTYKANRGDRKKPLGYAGCVERIRKDYVAYTYPCLEADDVLGYLHTGGLSGALETVLVSQDKDMRTLPGALYNPGHPEEGVVTITKNEADVWHLIMAITGDSADGYKGCPGVGIKGAEKALCNVRRKDWWKTVVKLFESKGETEETALRQAQLAHIVRFEDYDERSGDLDLWTPDKLESC